MLTSHITKHIGIPQPRLVVCKDGCMSLVYLLTATVTANYGQPSCASRNLENHLFHILSQISNRFYELYYLFTYLHYFFIILYNPANAAILN